jgi:translation initiation factor IF-2
VLESCVDPKLGRQVDLLVQWGTLQINDVVVAGNTWGRIKTMQSHTGKKLKQAGPSIPVRATGFRKLPSPGDLVLTVGGEKQAKTVAEWRAEQAKLKQQEADESERKTLGLKALPREEVICQLVASAAGSVGPITTSDVERASMAGQVLYGFDTVAARGAHAEAKSLGVDIKMHSVIYDLMIELREHLSEFLPAEYVCSEVQCVQ